jgi:hypothetical protein
MEAAKKDSYEPAKLQALSCVYWSMDRRTDSDATLAALEHGFATRNAYEIASAHAYRGEADAAFAWLDRGYEQLRASLEFVKYDPLFRNLHGDPRFDASLQKANLVE